VAAPFAATAGGVKVLGFHTCFYTLSATSIQLTELPAELTKKLPRYPRLPATLLGHLAPDLSARGFGLGRILLVDAITRAVRSEIASFAFLLETTVEAAPSFYEREEFIRLPAKPIRFVRCIYDIAALVASA